MKPKKKAEQLFNKINIHIPINASFKDSADEASWKIEKDHISTKKIALIIINEIIISHEMSINCEDIVLNYWKEVKQELEKL